MHEWFHNGDLKRRTKSTQTRTQVRKVVIGSMGIYGIALLILALLPKK
jgi:hypothetical protein